MPALDVKSAYNEARTKLGLGPHNDHDPEDYRRMELYIAGVSAGTSHALQSIKDQAEQSA